MGTCFKDGGDRAQFGARGRRQHAADCGAFLPGLQRHLAGDFLDEGIESGRGRRGVLHHEQELASDAEAARISALFWFRSP
jgi:hypothetical protein